MKFLIHHLLEASADERPDQIALVDRERALSYADLEAQANQVANLLLEIALAGGDRVGIYLEKSAEAVAGIYGVLKAGGAYVPIDPASPPSRAAHIIRDCGIRILLTGAKEVEIWKQLEGDVPELDHVVILNRDGSAQSLGGTALRTRSDVEASPDHRPRVRTINLDLAYILYTSGSTGNPKGVMLSHLNGLTFVEWAAGEFSLRPEDRLTSLAPLHFDLSIFDLFSTAAAGASVHLVPKRTAMFPAELRRFLGDQAITVMYSVPSVLTMLVERGGLRPRDLPDLRAVLFAGEVFPTKYLSRLMKLLPTADFTNLYGPTETNVCTFYRVPDRPPEDGRPISIGKAVANIETFVMSGEGTLAAQGEVGELYVRGGTVMAGYWGDPERTARSRLSNPLGGELTDPVYRTGDLVRQEEDGTYTFLGRRDNQIKSRGYRIELGEIEAALASHPNVLECAVVAVPDDLVTNRLYAYVVTSGTLDERELVKHCGQLLPTYMIPERVQLEVALPKTSTGKIDGQALQNRAMHEGDE